ncbi:hypothetical protein TVAG_538960, partial [Trichomonas vaginalis G3]
MEITALNSIINSDIFPKIHTFVSDGDVKTNTALNHSKTSIQITKDSNHLIKNAFNKFKDQLHFLESQFRIIFADNTLTIEQKVQKWLDTKKKYVNRQNYSEICETIDATAFLFRCIRKGLHTNFNESINALKARLIPKFSSWSIGFVIRMFVVVIAYNEPRWKELLRTEFFKFDISMYDEQIQNRIKRIESRSEHVRNHRAQKETKKRAIAVRWARKHKANVEPEAEAYKSPKKETNTIKIAHKKKDLIGNIPIKDWKRKFFFITNVALDNVDFQSAVLSIPYLYVRFSKDYKYAVILIKDYNASMIIDSSIYLSMGLQREPLDDEVAQKVIEN